jgi:hypothetical protein
MIETPKSTTRPKTFASARAIALSLAMTFAAAPAFAGESEAKDALQRAEVKIETVTRQAGRASDIGDQSFNMAQERVESAREAIKDAKYDRAEMLADEASVLADLTVERAVLAALKTSQANLMQSVSATTAAQ